MKRAVCACLLSALVAPALAASDYAIVVSEKTRTDAEWGKVVAALVNKHDGTVISVKTSIGEALPALRGMFPRYTCFVATPFEATRESVAQVHKLAGQLDADPYTDTFWGILTGYDAANALAIALHAEPLVVRKVASGTEFAMDMVEEGVWYDELVKNKAVRKTKGGKAQQLKCPTDTTQALVDTLNTYHADLFITSGHATEANWMIGYRFRSGFFKCKAGQMFGEDTKKARIAIDSANPKVYLPIGNCLMGHINGPDAMALAWMNDVGVKQMLGYTKPTWFGYMGWGVLDTFVEQPGRYTLTEAFFANHHALVHRLLDNATPARDRRGLTFDRDVVAFYGDPKWSAKMADAKRAYEQKLDVADGVYTLTITPNRGRDSFKPINTNGSQRGWRPIVQFLPHRVTDVAVTAGADLKPVVTDDFILVPNPRECDPARRYVVAFRAKPVGLGGKPQMNADGHR